MPRLFVAIDFPVTVREKIANICFGVRGAKWVAQEQFHLTLCFLGEVNDTIYHNVSESLCKVKASTFYLSIKGVGFFPPRRTPNVLWVGVEHSDHLLKLQKDIVQIIRKNGVETDARKFHPHITVARLKEHISEYELIPFLSSNSLFEAGPVCIKEFHLYSSILKSDGPIHTREVTYALND